MEIDILKPTVNTTTQYVPIALDVIKTRPVPLPMAEKVASGGSLGIDNELRLGQTAKPELSVRESNQIGGSTATANRLQEGFSLFIIPPVVRLVNLQKQELSDRMRQILDALIPQLNEFATRRYIPIERVEISEFQNPEEDNDRSITITQWLDVPAKTALEYWDELALIVDDFIFHLSPGLARVAQEQINVEVFWKDDQPLLFTDAL